MQEVPGQPSCKCGPAPHLISAHQAGWMQQAASVLQMLCETGPHPRPPCIPALCDGNTLAGCYRREPGGPYHTHTELARLLYWSLVDTGGMLSWTHPCQKSRPLSCPLSILRPPSETPIVCYPYVPHSHPLVWYLQRKSECRWESVVLTRLG